MILHSKIILFLLTIAVTNNSNGTTSANFLEIDIGSRATSMGGAYVSLCEDPSAIFWNPSGLTYIERTETLFMYQPYWDDTNIIFAGVATPLGNSSYIGAGMFLFNWGDIEQTDLIYQDGTGVIFSPNEYSFSVSYARKFVEWFSFGSSIKFISSNLDVGRISGSAFAIDLGVMIETDFFSSTKQKDGLKIGMSISNYGTKLKYNEGIGLLIPSDISEDNGNWDNLLTQVYTEGDELPLNFRIGCSLKPLNTLHQKLILSIDAIHPNNNPEYLNIGMEYLLLNMVSVRVGKSHTFYQLSNGTGDGIDPQQGFSFGTGIRYKIPRGPLINIDYMLTDFGVFNNIQGYSISLTF